MPPSKAEIILESVYGFIPEPTCGETRVHELMIDSNQFQEYQLKTDLLRIARSAKLTGDAEMGQIAMNQWNKLYPNNKYTNLDLFLGVEDE